MPGLWLAFALYIANEETDYGRQEELFFPQMSPNEYAIILS